MKQIRKRLTYANVMSSIAVFLVLGGGAAVAANQLGKNSVGSKQLKKNAVTTAKIKNNAITASKIKNGAISGEKINLGSLGNVPNATHAQHAATATNAQSANHATNANNAANAVNAGNAANANTVGGLSVKKFFAKIPDGGAQTAIFSGDGFSLRAACEGGDTELDAVKTPGAPSMTATAVVFHTGADEFGTSGNLNFSSVDLDEGFPTVSGKLELTRSAGTVTTIQYTARQPQNFVPNEDVCVYGGTVISG